MELLKGSRIWIVEDEADIGELIKINLELEGVSARCFLTGEEFLKEFQSDAPDLLIQDLMHNLVMQKLLHLTRWTQNPKDS